MSNTESGCLVWSVLFLHQFPTYTHRKTCTHTHTHKHPFSHCVCFIPVHTHTLLKGGQGWDFHTPHSPERIQYSTEHGSRTYIQRLGLSTPSGSLTEVEWQKHTEAQIQIHTQAPWRHASTHTQTHTHMLTEHSVPCFCEAKAYWAKDLSLWDPNGNKSTDG